MNRSEFLRLMKFPAEWSSLGMYPDELANLQIRDYEPGSESSSEHFRMGAFVWWESKISMKEQVTSLFDLMQRDPDQVMAEDARKRLVAKIAGTSLEI